MMLKFCVYFCILMQPTLGGLNKFKSTKVVQSPVVNPDKTAPNDFGRSEAGKHFEGDILLNGKPGENNRNAYAEQKKRWSDGKVCYYFDTDSLQVKNDVAAAIADFHSYSCIRFHERTSADSDCIRIFQDSGCYSHLGKTGGQQDLSLGYGCEGKGVAIHELLHALGFTHEQSREDRDDFVEILWQNIEDDAKSQFQKEFIGFSAFGQPYDLNSVMHYGINYFTKNYKNTIRPKDASITQLGQRQGFTELDLKKLNKAYCDTTLVTAGATKETVDMSVTQKATLLDSINSLRRKQGASNMWKLAWDDTLAAAAKPLAEQCKKDQEFSVVNGQAIVQYTHSSSYTDLNRALQPILDRIDTIFQSRKEQSQGLCENFEATHYSGTTCSQYINTLVNAASKKVGCAVTKCQGIAGTTLVANVVYHNLVCVVQGAPQNNMNAFSTEGAACSACANSNGCDDGLCVESAPSPTTNAPIQPTTTPTEGPFTPTETTDSTLTEGPFTPTEPTDSTPTEGPFTPTEPTDSTPTEGPFTPTEPTDSTPTEGPFTPTEPTDSTPTEGPFTPTETTDSTPTEGPFTPTETTDSTPTEGPFTPTETTDSTPTEGPFTPTEPTDSTPTEGPFTPTEPTDSTPTEGPALTTTTSQGGSGSSSAEHTQPPTPVCEDNVYALCKSFEVNKLCHQVMSFGVCDPCGICVKKPTTTIPPRPTGPAFKCHDRQDEKSCQHVKKAHRCHMVKGQCDKTCGDCPKGRPFRR